MKKRIKQPCRRFGGLCARRMHAIRSAEDGVEGSTKGSSCTRLKRQTTGVADRVEEVEEDLVALSIK